MTTVEDQVAPHHHEEHLNRTRQRLQDMQVALQEAQEVRRVALAAYEAGDASVGSVLKAETCISEVEHGIRTAKFEITELEAMAATARVAAEREVQVQRMVKLAADSYAARDEFTGAMEKVNDALGPLMADVWAARKRLIASRLEFLRILGGLFGRSEFNSLHSKHRPELEVEVRAVVAEVESRGVSANLVLTNLERSQLGSPIDRNLEDMGAYPRPFGELMDALITIAARGSL